MSAVDPTGDPRWQAVRVLRRNPAYLDPYTPAAAVVESLEAAGLRIVHRSRLEALDREEL